ncbi:hypothetical protein [Deinococcus hopiensis]|uniref:hypothetical protein n=1 Tax=Deinococcus hopiensis TaxID=309885 RepID=UPI001FEB7153|nr:hypothetical protein [Deinococcus hopiensis]
MSDTREQYTSPDVLAKRTRCFTAHFPELCRNQVERLPPMVLALLQAKDVRHAALAARFSGSAQTRSVIRRVERVFDRHPPTPADVARAVLALLPQARPREFIMDRTNGKHGQTDVNALMLAVLWRGVAVPLLFELLPHGGSSDAALRQALMDDALCLLTAPQIRVLYADREFVGHDPIQGAAQKGIPICVRLRRRQQDRRVDGPGLARTSSDRLCRSAHRAA